MNRFVEVTLTDGTIKQVPIDEIAAVSVTSVAAKQVIHVYVDNLELEVPYNKRLLHLLLGLEENNTDPSSRVVLQNLTAESVLAQRYYEVCQECSTAGCNANCGIDGLMGGM